MAMPRQWIKLGSPDCAPGAKTFIWTVRSTVNEAILGEVRWYAPWRRYCFFPLSGYPFDPECLTQIAVRCQVETDSQKETWKRKPRTRGK